MLFSGPLSAWANITESALVRSWEPKTWDWQRRWSPEGWVRSLRGKGCRGWRRLALFENTVVGLLRNLTS